MSPRLFFNVIIVLSQLVVGVFSRMMDIEKKLHEIADDLVELRKSERELERSFDKRFLELTNTIHGISERLSVDIAALKATAAAYGDVAGIIPGLIVYLIDFMKGK